VACPLSPLLLEMVEHTVQAMHRSVWPTLAIAQRSARIELDSLKIELSHLRVALFRMLVGLPNRRYDGRRRAALTQGRFGTRCAGS
jgi:hypothetical protein